MDTVDQIDIFDLGTDAETKWMETALCAESVLRRSSLTRAGSDASAKRVCIVCEVRSDCLAYAVQRQIRDGIWGGLAGRERRNLSPATLHAVA